MARRTDRYLVALSLGAAGPVLTALMVTGRVGSAIAAELGSMSVSQQIDAMRALGTDPIRKLVGPRLFALVIMLPLLTVIADVVGIGGGWTVATGLYGMSTSTFFTSVQDGITADDILGGVIKPSFSPLSSVQSHVIKDYRRKAARWASGARRPEQW